MIMSGRTKNNIWNNTFCLKLLGTVQVFMVLKAYKHPQKPIKTSQNIY